MYVSDTFSPQKFTSEGKITLRGKEIPFHTVSEDNVFYDSEGKAIASMFSYSYFRSDVEDTSKRPVLFCFNGGPGSSSMMVHAGFLAPWRLKYYDDPDCCTGLPPYEIIDNPDCMLDKADIVVIDPIGAGFGLLLDEKYEKEFYGIEEDAEAFLKFVEMWLTRYKRWNSPKYLVGESYGCTRAATMAGLGQISGGKDRQYNIAFDGVVLIGNTVAPGPYLNENCPCEHSVIFFPTYAAVNWYHNHPTNQTVDEFAKEAKEWADTVYNLALYKGNAISDEEKEEVIKKVMYYTGVSREYLLENGLKVDNITFRSQVVRDRGLQVGRNDGRITRPFFTPKVRENNYGPLEDSTGKYDPFFRTAVCGTIFPRLNIDMSRPFVPLAHLYLKWNYKDVKATTGEYLSAAMLRVPGMRTFFANGWYDLCTLIGIAYYTITHAGLPKDRTFIKEYPSGHMVYLGEENVKNLSSDILKFIEK